MTYESAMRTSSLFPLLPPLLFALLGLDVLRQGVTLGIGSADYPGPGLWPVLAGGGLTACALPLFAFAFRNFARGRAQSRAKIEMPGVRPDGKALCGLVLASVCWIAMLPFLGWAVATWAATLIAGRSAGNGWKALIALCLGLTFVLYMLTHWIAPLPAGMVWDMAGGADV